MIIRRLSQVRKETVGGKALGLFRLQEKGFRVPDFFVLPASVFSSYLNNKQNILSQAQKSEVLTILDTWHWKEEGVAVRSSIAGEDGLDHAFPGMMDSFLNVKDESGLWKGIEDVVQSAWSDRAMAYRREKQIAGSIVPAVIIQQQIKAELSGVVFTVNPVYPREMAIHTVSGLGIGLVSGAVAPTEIYLDRSSGKIIHQQIPAQQERYVTHSAGGVECIKSEGDGQLSPALTTALYQTCLQVEQHMGTAQDIEFCVVHDLIYLLQSRPITSPVAAQTIYDNSNIQESYCGVTTPLTFSFARRAYATVYTQTMQALGLRQQTIEAHQNLVENLLGLVKGRIYYNINNWYRGLQLLPSFRQNKEDMERMMGLLEPVDFIEDQQKSLLQKVRLVPRLLMNLGRLLYSFSRLEESTSAFQTHFKQYFEQFYTMPLHQMTLAGLWQQKEQLDRTLLHRWTTPIINDFYVMMKNGAALRMLKKSTPTHAEETLKRQISGDRRPGDRIHGDRIHGDPEIDSLKPTLELIALANTAKKDSDLCALLSHTTDDLHDKVAARFPGFFAEVQQYIHRYGDRTVGELKLETITMRVNPQIFYHYLNNYLSTDVAFSLHTTPPAPLASAQQKKLEPLKKGIRRRESMRLERTRLFGMYRTLFRLIGQQFARQGILAQASDVFYLEEEEIASLIQSPTNTKAAIEERKHQYKKWEDEMVPSRVIVPSRAVANPDAGTSKDHLQGEPCVPGKVKGEAILISRPDDDLSVKGKIICALRTDPGWAALFPVCKAVLIEKGSSLSHSVILLRELGVPTIINIPGLTQSVSTGMIIELDAGTGEILLKEKAN